MARRDDDAAYGLTPREWLDADPVPLTPDVDLSDPEQFTAWARANNEENRARFLELQARRDGASGGGDGASRRPRMGATTAVTVRFLNAEQRALVRAARRHNLSVSDLVRRWVRAGLEEEVEPDVPDARRDELAGAADAIVDRINGEVRRLREIVVSSG